MLGTVRDKSRQLKTAAKKSKDGSSNILRSLVRARAAYRFSV